MVADSGTTAGKLLRGESTELGETPILRKALGNVTEGYQQRRFYDRLYEIVDIDAELNRVKGTEVYARRREGVGDRLKLIPLAKRTKTQYSKLRKLLEAAKEAGDTARVEKVEAAMERLRVAFLSRYNATVLGMS